MNVAERSKLWLKAKAYAELDGFMLPPAFVAQAEGYIRGTATLDDLIRVYESLLPEEETLRLMFEQYTPDYVDLNLNEYKDIETLWAEKKDRLAKEIVSQNGLTVRNIMGMQFALKYLTAHDEEVGGDV